MGQSLKCRRPHLLSLPNELKHLRQSIYRDVRPDYIIYGCQLQYRNLDTLDRKVQLYEPVPPANVVDLDVYGGLVMISKHTM